MPQKLITLSQLATILNCTLSAVRKWRRENRIATVKIGRLVRVDEDEVYRIARQGLRPTSKRVRP
jgi:excisionase family DNA binding protein